MKRPTNTGHYLKLAREQRGMSQQDVAHRLNLRISLIRDIEQDRFDQKQPVHSPEVI